MSKPIRNYFSSDSKCDMRRTQESKRTPSETSKSPDKSFNMDSMMEKCANMLDQKLDSKLADLATKQDLSDLQKEITLLREENFGLKKEVNGLKIKLKR